MPEYFDSTLSPQQPLSFAPRGNRKSIVVTTIICVLLIVPFFVYIYSFIQINSQKKELESQIVELSKRQVEENKNAVDATPKVVVSSPIPSPTSEPKPTTPAAPAKQTAAFAPTATPTPTTAPKYITSTTLSIEPLNADVCGTKFTFRGYITATGAGTVTYRWKRSDAENVTSLPYPTVTFESAGTKEVDYNLTLSENREGDGWFEVTSPESAASNRIHYSQKNC